MMRWPWLMGWLVAGCGVATGDCPELALDPDCEAAGQPSPDELVWSRDACLEVGEDADACAAECVQIGEPAADCAAAEVLPNPTGDWWQGRATFGWYSAVQGYAWRVPMLGFECTNSVDYCEKAYAFVDAETGAILDAGLTLDG